MRYVDDGESLCVGRSESAYFDIVDTHFEAIRLASLVILTYLSDRAGAFESAFDSTAQVSPDASPSAP